MNCLLLQAVEAEKQQQATTAEAAKAAAEAKLKAVLAEAAEAAGGDSKPQHTAKGVGPAGLAAPLTL